MNNDKEKNKWKLALVPSPLAERECKCGCGHRFIPSRKDKVYLNSLHANHAYNSGPRKRKNKKVDATNRQLRLNDRILETHHKQIKGDVVGAFLLNLKAEGFDSSYFTQSTIKGGEQHFALYHYAYSIYTKNNQQIVKIYKL